MSLLHPEFLWFLLLVPALWFFPRRTKDPVHAALRSALMICLILGLARPVTLDETAPRHLVAVVDASASLDAAERDALSDRLVALARSATGDGADVIGHLVWMGPPLPDMPRDVTERFGEIRRLDEGSPIGLALEIAAEQVPSGASGSLVLFSDGLSTEVDRGWGDAVQTLGRRGIPVNTVSLRGLRGDLRPVRADAEGTWRIGRSSKLLVDVVGAGQDAKVRVSRDQDVLAESEVRRIDGRTTFALDFEPDAAGRLDLEVEVELVRGEDARPANNRLSRSFVVENPMNVLYVGQRQIGGAEKLSALLGPSFRVEDSAAMGDLKQALDDRDLVVIDDCPASQISEELQNAVIEAVQEKGTGLVVAGGSAAFGPGGYHETPLAGVMPVEFVQKEEKKDPSTALAVIIDTSGSMGGQRIVLAKEVTRLAIRRLLPHDKVGIVEFYGAKRWAAPLQSAANSINIQRALNRLDAGGGTVILPAIEEAFYGLKNVQTRYKHVLILTDGGVETGAFEPLLRAMAKDGVTVSTVLVGPGRHSDFLVELADWGKGRFYNASDRFNLPEVILKQPSTSRLPAYRPGVHALKARGGPGWWGDVDPRQAPALAGYVETRARVGAEVLLETAKESHPVLATWRHGLGRVTAMTTEPTGAGTKPWKDWSDYGTSLARLCERTAGVDLEPWKFEVERRGNRVTVRASRRDPRAEEPAIMIDDWTADSGEAATEAPRLAMNKLSDGERRLILEWPEDRDFIAYGIPSKERDSGFVSLLSPLGVDRAPELNVDPARGIDLELLAAETGGSAGAGPGAPTNLAYSEADAALSLRRIWPFFVLLALLFYLGDILWRRRPNRPVAE